MKNKKHSVAEISKRLQLYLPKKRHDTSTKICLVIDGMGLAYAAKYAHGKLSFRGTSTSLLFGVPQMIKSIVSRYRPEKVIVCWDGIRNPKRLEVYPDYKKKRDLKRDPVEQKRFKREVKKLRVLLYRMGIPQAYDKMVEGDDMVYFVVSEAVKTNKVIIYSGDKDFHQLINHDVWIFKPGKHGGPVSTFAFKGGYPVEVPQWIDYQCLVGDDSDNITGYRGIGVVRAGQFFEKFYRIKDFLKDKKAEFSGMTDKEEVERIYKRNRLLMDLEYFCKRYYPEGYKPIFYKGKRFPKWNEALYRKMCIKYNLRTMLSPSFTDIFKDL